MTQRRTRAPTDLTHAAASVFEQAFQRSPAMQSVVRASDSMIVEVNETFLATLGFQRDEIVGTSAQKIGFWVEPQQLVDYQKEFADFGHVAGREVLLRTKTGAVLTVLLSSHPVEIDGETHILSAGVDISERKRAEERLHESQARLRENEAQLRSLYDGISTPVIVQDETGLILANPAALRLFGGSQQADFIGKGPQDFSPPVQPDGTPSAFAVQRNFERVIAEGYARFEWVGRKSDGTLIPLDVTLTRIQLGGRPVIQSVIIDLTERKRAEEEQQRRLEQERELHQLKSNFVSLVSHEFRTPLEVIMSSVDNLDRYHERLPAEKRKHLLRTINKSVRRMAGMMEEVLLLGRLDSGGTEFNPQPLDLPVLCARIVDEMESATNRRCPIELELADGIEGACGDEAVLRHIFSNLISNAAKYSDPGVAITFAARREGTHGVFSICDRGCGIPAADQPRLFQAFTRGSNVRQTPGTGLGLLIVRRCVDLHRGEISFESIEGRGTTFTVRLPLFDRQP